MSTFRPRRPSTALVVSLIALIATLGGTAYAGVTLGKNSVGTRQLKSNAVTSSKIKNGAVTGSKLTLTGVTVPDATRASTADTATNATNATNAVHADHATSADSATNAGHATNADAATALGTVFYRTSAKITAPGCGSSPCAGAFSDTPGHEMCPTGTVVIAGGFGTSASGLELNDGNPSSSAQTGPLDEWSVFVDNFTPSDQTFTVSAICVKARSQDVGPAASAAVSAIR